MTARTWTDQPLVCEACNIVCTIPTSRGTVEVRATHFDPGYYVTCGSLFGSQTVFCDDVDALLAVLQVATNTRKGTLPLPDGCHLVEDGKPPMVKDASGVEHASDADACPTCGTNLPREDA